MAPARRAPPADLAETLEKAQVSGLIGPGPIEEAIAHAERFVAAIPHTAGRLADLGSGGGLPGLVIAARRPTLDVVLVDRKGRAIDFLRRAVRALAWEDRVDVVRADVGTLGRQPRWRGAFDVVTARGVGAPGLVAEWAVPLVRTGGRLVVSVAGDGDQWTADGLARLGATILSRANGLIVVQAGVCPARYPRVRPAPLLF